LTNIKTHQFAVRKNRLNATIDLLRKITTYFSIHLKFQAPLSKCTLPSSSSLSSPLLPASRRFLTSMSARLALPTCSCTHPVAPMTAPVNSSRRTKFRTSLLARTSTVAPSSRPNSRSILSPTAAAVSFHHPEAITVALASCCSKNARLTSFLLQFVSTVNLTALKLVPMPISMTSVAPQPPMTATPRLLGRLKSSVKLAVLPISHCKGNMGVEGFSGRLRFGVGGMGMGPLVFGYLRVRKRFPVTPF